MYYIILLNVEKTKAEEWESVVVNRTINFEILKSKGFEKRDEWIKKL